jgi:hypothetical protein
MLQAGRFFFCFNLSSFNWNMLPYIRAISWYAHFVSSELMKLSRDLFWKASGLLGYRSRGQNDRVIRVTHNQILKQLQGNKQISLFLHCMWIRCSDLVPLLLSIITLL